jgi:predicted aldo/keto reductase-like oxidoreductase
LRSAVKVGTQQLPKKKIAQSEEVKRYLDESLGVSRTDMIGRFVVLRADSQNGKENGEP